MNAYSSNTTKRNESSYNIIEKLCTKMDQVGIIHYLPQDEIITPSKATIELRIVYDASSLQKGEGFKRCIISGTHNSSRFSRNTASE